MAVTKSTHADFTELSPTAWKVKISVPEEKFRGNLKKFYRELSQNINIPGFRPGKAPDNVINRHYGRQNIINETYQEVIKDTLWPVLQEKELTVVGPPKIDHDHWQDGSDFVYTARLEVMPQIPEVDYSLLTATLPERKFEDKELGEELRRMALRLGESEVISDRPVEKGDVILSTFEGEVADVMVDGIDGEQPWKIKDDNMEIEIGADHAIAGLEELFIGMDLEEIKDIELVLPGDFADRRVRGETLVGKIRVKGIRSVTPAELTDEFIKEKLGEQKIETLEQLKEKVGTEVQAQWQQMDDRSIVDQIEAVLSRTYDFPLPEGLVRAKYADILDRTLDAIKKDDGDVDKLMEDGNTTGVKIRKRARFQAERTVRLDLIMREVARKESIGVQQEEVINYIAYLAMRQGIAEKDLKTLIQDAQFIEATKNELLEKKVIHFLVDKTTSEKVAEEDFRKMIDEARSEGEAHEKEFIGGADDPVNMKDDYLEEAGDGETEIEEKAEAVPSTETDVKAGEKADEPSESEE